MPMLHCSVGDYAIFSGITGGSVLYGWFVGAVNALLLAATASLDRPHLALNQGNPYDHNPRQSLASSGSQGHLCLLHRSAAERKPTTRCVVPNCVLVVRRTLMAD